MSDKDTNQVEDRQEQMAQTGRLAELGVMSAAVLHEMAQPLAGIKGFAELILQCLERGDPARIQALAQEIRNQVTRVQQMQKNVSNFLQRQERSDEPVLLKPALDQSLSLFSNRIQKHGINLGRAIPDDLPPLDISLLQLTQILINLIGNALDAMADSNHGILRLSATFDRSAGRVRILVADNGTGISAEAAGRIFEPFFSTKQDKGTGLGLHISQTLAKNNGGHLKLLDPKTLGWKTVPSTVFELDLPTVQEAESQKPAQAEAAPEAVEPAQVAPAVPEDFLQTLNQKLGEYARDLDVTKRVLVVDDEDVIRMVISEHLANQEIMADIVPSAEEGLDYLERKNYAVLVTDKNLPGMDGISLLKTIKEQSPHVEVVVITGYASIETALEAIGAGAFDYIPKPLPSLDYLSEKVRGALARHDFEVRVHAMIGYLSKTLKSMLAELKGEEQAGWIKKLKEVLASNDDTKDQAKVLVLGPQTLVNTVEKLGYPVLQANSLSKAVESARQGQFRVLVFNEEEGGASVDQVMRRIHEVDASLGVFVIAREGSLNNIVEAIGSGVGDYLVRPLEGRELFGPRLERLISRQQRILRYRHLLEALRNLSIDLQTSLG